jgi:hypothetical protein
MAVKRRRMAPLHSSCFGSQPSHRGDRPLELGYIVNAIYEIDLINKVRGERRVWTNKEAICNNTGRNAKRPANFSRFPA